MNILESSPPIHVSDVIVIGGGAVGLYLAWTLQSSGADVRLICRSNASAVAAYGICLENGDSQFPSVVSSADLGNQYAKFAVLATKTTESRSSLESVLRSLPGSPAIVVAQNGLAPEKWITEAFPDRLVIGCVLFCPIAKLSPNTIRPPTGGSIAVGRWPIGDSPLADEFARLIHRPTTPCRTTRDLHSVRWQKSVWNTAFNLLSVVHSHLETREMATHADIRSDLQQIMEEVWLVARRASVYLPRDLIQQFIHNSVSMPQGRTSMAEDALAGRPLEIESIAGDILREARHLGVSTPELERLIVRIAPWAGV